MRLGPWRWFLAIGLCLASMAAVAEDPYPSKPIKLIVPFPPGGSSDLVVRAYAPKLAELLGQQVVIDYKAGAGGSIGTAEVAHAAPDGYTLIQVWDTHAVNHHLYKTSYDFARSFEPLSLLVQAPGILVARPDFGTSSVRELIDLAKANPGSVTYGSAGTGSSNHLSGVRFSDMTGIVMIHVPYKGGGPLTTDLLGGHIDIVFGTIGLFEPYVRSGKMKALAVLSKTRVPQLPDVPAASETVQGFEAITWFGLLAPAGTPKAILTRLQTALVKALNDEKVRQQLSARGFEVVASTPEAFSTFLTEQSDSLGSLIHKAGIKPD
jgi:tripartite-type tricarboxylate transporter receptor subunit TctC